MSDNSPVHPKLILAAEALARILFERKIRIVFAESCTAGLLASSLSQIAGISEALCGSAVTYRNGTKVSWLGVDRDMLDDVSIGPVSEITAIQMCRGILQMTPESDVAVSITGHLGPGAPDDLDGIAYCALLSRSEESPRVRRLELCADSTDPIQIRRERQFSAAVDVFTFATEQLHVSIP